MRDEERIFGEDINNAEPTKKDKIIMVLIFVTIVGLTCGLVEYIL